MCVGLGAEIVVGGGTMVEFVPTAKRGRIVAMLGLCSAFGAIVASVANYLITPNLGWRWMFVTGGISALLVWHRPPGDAGIAALARSARPPC